MEYKILEKMFEGENPKSVFEIGVGGGGLLKEVSDHFGGIEMGGIDISKVRMENLKNLKGEFLLHDLNDPWPVPDNSFDIVFSVGVLMYIFDPGFVLKEMFRVAKEKIILAEYHHSELNKFGLLTQPFQDAQGRVHHGIIRNYLDILKDIRKETSVQIIDSGQGKTIIKCQK